MLTCLCCIQILCLSPLSSISDDPPILCRVAWGCQRASTIPENVSRWTATVIQHDSLDPDKGFGIIFRLSCSVDKSQISAFTEAAESFNSPSVVLIGDKHMWDYHVRRNDQTQTWLRLHFIADTKPNTTDKYIGHYFIEFHDNVNGRSYVIITYSLYNCNHKCKIFEKRIQVKPRNHPLKRKVFDMMILILQLSVSYTRGMPDDQFAFYADNELQGGFTLPAMRGNVRLGHTFMLMPGQTNVAAIYRASDQIENESWSLKFLLQCVLRIVKI